MALAGAAIAFSPACNRKPASEPLMQVSQDDVMAARKLISGPESPSVSMLLEDMGRLVDREGRGPGSRAAIVGMGIDAVPTLIMKLDDPRNEVQTASADALGAIVRRHPEHDWKPALIVLTNWLEGTLNQQLGADSALVFIGPPAVPALLGVRTNGSTFAKKRAAEALRTIADTHPEGIPSWATQAP